ncbi:unnamed protein product [Prorocentrum cordatum]|uniref:Uncharacterized protein n=1 Tax=Prorocentrum cordatum TaxID=2364126 RepID=A0ABN9R6E9_9DINO|nr:unnamed protein product [Polarella glacialis]
MVTVLKIIITETDGGTVEELPVFSPDRPCYLADLRQAAVPSGQSGAHMVLSGPQRAVTWNGEGTSMTYQNMKDGNDGAGYTIRRRKNGRQLRTLQSGRCTSGVSRSMDIRCTCT